MQFIELGGKTYPIQFGVSLMKELGHRYKLPKIIQADQLISSIEWGDLGWVAHAGIENAINVLGNGQIPDLEEISEMVAQDLGTMTMIIEVMTRQLDPTAGKENGEEKKATTEATEPIFKK